MPFCSAFGNSKEQQDRDDNATQSKNSNRDRRIGQGKVSRVKEVFNQTDNGDNFGAGLKTFLVNIKYLFFLKAHLQKNLH